MGTGELTVDFVGDVRTLAPGGSLSFGRAADLVVDDANRYLHRVVGRLVWHDGVWWLENLGDHIELELVAADGTLVRLAPRPEGGDPNVAAVTAERSRLGFTAGGLPYGLDLTLDAGTRPGGVEPEPRAGESTSRYGHVALTDDERRLLTALATPVLRDPTVGPEGLVSNRELAMNLGWALTKFNRKLDYLCTRLTKAGVRGLVGARGEEATNRRWRLVEHAVAARLITVADLDRPPS
ncbi:MAG: hypothetical protein H0V33_12560 [Acidimicrobiia bacterium]|nr:hypothetical protein [Acidimicrobiia bacterium]